MRNIQNRLRRLVGQLEGVGRMLEKKEDCLKVLIQIKAAKSALNALSAKILTENLCKCSRLKSKKDRAMLEQLVTELSKI